MTVPGKWIRNKADQVAVEQGHWFDQEAADYVCSFFETFLKHSKGQFAGQPFVLLDWERDYLSRLYGWKRPDGTRRFRESYLEIPKKQGKSALLSGIAVLSLFEEPGAEVYCGAVDRSQASIIHDESCRMVQANPALSRHLEINNTQKRIVFPARHSKLVAMSADAPSKDGVSASVVILDEVHRFKNDELYNVMKYAGAARRQPLLISITTAGFDRTSLCYRLHKRAMAILEGSTDDLSFLPVVYGADLEKDDLDSPEVWRRCNPSMGVIISEEDFAREHAEAKANPKTWNNFLRLRLNVWTKAETRWISLDQWDALKEDYPDLRGQKCYAGLDLSSTEDLTALSLVFPGDPIRVLPFFFVPKGNAQEREDRDKVPYVQWGKRGYVELTTGCDGLASDHDAVRKKLNELAEIYKIEKVAIDRWNAHKLANELVDDGFEVIGFGQGYKSFNAPCHEFERFILAGGIRHDGNPCLRWNVGNCAVKQDEAESMKPVKMNRTDRIDGLVATLMALGLSLSEQTKSAPVITFA